ncbi:MAG TPA: SRPBCC family protein [Ktedonobacterales bacterium]
MAKGVRDEQYATVIARASAHELYQIVTRYAQYPQIFRFVRLVTPYGGRYSHWEARVLGYNKWEAVNEGWIENQQVGWRVTSGWGASGRIRLQPLLAQAGCRIHVFMRYQPRGGLFADLADELVLGQRFERRLREDLRRFATMIEKAPEGGLDPFSPRYLFSTGGVAARERRAAAAGRHL